MNAVDIFLSGAARADIHSSPDVFGQLISGSREKLLNPQPYRTVLIGDFIDEMPKKLHTKYSQWRPECDAEVANVSTIKDFLNSPTASNTNCLVFNTVPDQETINKIQEIPGRSLFVVIESDQETHVRDMQGISGYVVKREEKYYTVTKNPAGKWSSERNAGKELDHALCVITVPPSEISAQDEWVEFREDYEIEALVPSICDHLVTVGANTGGCILDLCCGDGQIIHEIGKRFPSSFRIGIDSSPLYNDLWKGLLPSDENLSFIKADVNDLSKTIPDGIADIVVINHTLDQLYEGELRNLKISFLKEAVRVLKKGGILHINNEAEEYIKIAIQRLKELGMVVQKNDSNPEFLGYVSMKKTSESL